MVVPAVLGQPAKKVEGEKKGRKKFFAWEKRAYTLGRALTAIGGCCGPT